MQSLFKYTFPCPNVLRINGLLGLTNEFFYLVIGERAAAYIDTGFGFGDLPAFARQFTQLPLIVLNTHGHLDHIGGCFQFERSYIAPEDESMLISSYDPAALEEMGRSALQRAGIFVGCEPLVAPKQQIQVLPIHDGQIFDLGGVTLEAITMPGHSKGCVSFLYREERILFSGDNCGPQPLIMLPHAGGTGYSSDTLAVFSRSLHKLLDRQADFSRIFNCHKRGELPLSCFHGVVDAVDGVLSGKYPGVPTSVMNGKITNVFSAKGLDPERIDQLPNGFSGDVIFAKDNIR